MALQRQHGGMLIDDALDAHHDRRTRAVDVGVHEADASAPLLQGQGEVGGDGRLAHAALAAGDGDEVLDVRQRDLGRWSAVAVGLHRSGLHLVVSRKANGALTQRPQVFQGEDAGVVAVAPDDLVRVPADARHRDGRERSELAGLQDAKGVGRLFAFVTAAGARAVGAQVRPGVDAPVAVVPVDDETAGSVLDMTVLRGSPRSPPSLYEKRESSVLRTSADGAAGERNCHTLSSVPARRCGTIVHATPSTPRAQRNETEQGHAGPLWGQA